MFPGDPTLPVLQFFRNKKLTTVYMKAAYSEFFIMFSKWYLMTDF